MGNLTDTVNALRELRTEAGLSRQEVAEEAGLSGTRLYQIERYPCGTAGRIGVVITQYSGYRTWKRGLPAASETEIQSVRKAIEGLTAN